MRPIITITGEIPPEKLGHCQFHEHLLISNGKSREVNPVLYMDEPMRSAKEVERYREAGGNTIIDAQPGGCNRMAEGLAAISAQTGVSILCSTGFHKLEFYPEGHWIFRETQERLAEFFLQELTHGVDNHCDMEISGEIALQKAGLIKCALDKENLTPRYRRLFRAAAKAALQADRILMIHVEAGSDPLLLLRFLQQEGVPSDRLVFCHLDRAVADLSVHRKIMEAGAFLEFDTIGRFRYHSDEDEIAMFKDHLQNGFADRLLFSLDTTRARLFAYGPTEIGLDYILRVFTHKMLADGITQAQIDQIARKNPLRALTGAN